MRGLDLEVGEDFWGGRFALLGGWNGWWVDGVGACLVEQEAYNRKESNSA